MDYTGSLRPKKGGGGTLLRLQIYKAIGISPRLGIYKGFLKGVTSGGFRRFLI